MLETSRSVGGATVLGVSLTAGTAAADKREKCNFYRGEWEFLESSSTPNPPKENLNP